MSYILGIHIGHDATAALINYKGEIVGAIAEERLTRVKYITGFPYMAIEQVLKNANINKNEISKIATTVEALFHPIYTFVEEYYMSKDLEFKKERDLFNDLSVESKFSQVKSLIIKNLTGNGKQNNSNNYLEESKNYTKKVIREKINELGFENTELSIIDHHTCHAASAFYTSGKKDALTITIDGAGDGLCATASIIEDGKLKRISSASAACSPGRFYSEITRFLGFKRNRHEGKITGLAAFGNPEKYYNDLKQFLSFNPEKESFEFKEDNIEKNKYLSKINTLIRIINNENFGVPHIDSMRRFLEKNFHPKEHMKDLAAAVQKISEDIAVEYVKHFLKKYPNKNVVLAGGLFANVRINQVISEIEGVEFVFIHQNMGDGGCSVGAALYCLYDLNEKAYDSYSPNNVYFGNSYNDNEIESALKNSNLNYRKSDNIEAEIAKYIHSGKVIGRFNGGMEYGPRALGNRSLLGSPTDKSINDWLNKKLNRTEFMPFAPSVLEEEAPNLFENYSKGVASKASNFMTITYDVKENWKDKMQATTHIDGTARPQVVRKEDNPSFHKIIEEYHKLSGIPGVINTSFNMHEEPIVASPQDAIKALKQKAFDYLAIGNFICEV
ncbi:carbamoyltransferase family protein [Flexithrix dorotheae]|uniref:carbamoyltransferase family protein n=1 Tax=Flexithrix dorotheae TaxID=70993 RepID=UPI000366C13D|nr:carbamoyltransferase C-terminal domain-containing protein [Flexithrix dorotheae]